jgi:hypothetical protein
MPSATALVAANFAPGERFGHAHRSLDRSFGDDLKNGMPIGFLRDKYQARLRVGENLEPAILRLKQHGIRGFTMAVETPATIEGPQVADLHDLRQPSEASLGLVVELEVVQRTAWSELKLVHEGGEAVVYPPTSPGRYRLRIWCPGSVLNGRLVETSKPPAIIVTSACWIEGRAVIPAVP